MHNYLLRIIIITVTPVIVHLTMTGVNFHGISAANNLDFEAYSPCWPPEQSWELVAGFYLCHQAL